MASPELSGEDDLPEVTPRMFIRVNRGEGTERELEAIRRALKDPHSQLHDWLLAMEAWAEQTFGGRSSSTRAADDMIADAVARQHRQDVVLFLRRMQSAGRITEESHSQILAAGAPTPDAATPSPSRDYSQVTANMVRLAAQLHPEIAAELAQLSQLRGKDPNDQGRR